MTKKKDIGRWFEDQCSVPLITLCTKRGRMFYKFPDTRSSRGLIPAQPGEFMILIGGKAILIECKASAKHKTFRSCMSGMVRDSQYGWHKRWQLSGNPSVFLFYSEVVNAIEVWDGETILLARKNKKPLAKEDYLEIYSTIENTVPVIMSKILDNLNVSWS